MVAMGGSSDAIEPPFTSRKTVVDGAVVEFAKVYGFGHVVTRGELEKLFGIVWPDRLTRKDHATLGALFAACKADLDHELIVRHQMVLRPHGKGRWEIVKPQDQAKYAAEVARRGFADTTARAVSIAVNVRRDGLTDGQRRELDDTAARIAGIHAMSSGVLRRKAELPAPSAAPSATPSGVAAVPALPAVAQYRCRLCGAAGHNRRSCPKATPPAPTGTP